MKKSEGFELRLMADDHVRGDEKFPSKSKEGGNDTFHYAMTFFEYTKLFVWTIFVFLLVSIAFTGIANDWCVLQTYPFALFLLLFFGIILLAYIEALHVGCEFMLTLNQHNTQIIV